MRVVLAAIAFSAWMAPGVAPVLADDAAAPQTPHFIVHPIWLRRAGVDDLIRVYPDKASRDSRGGQGIVICRVTTEGGLTDCRLIDDEPLGYGFGAAAMELSKTFKMESTTADGLPTAGGFVRIPVRFKSPESSDGGPLVVNPRWATAPTAIQMANAYPKSGAGLAEFRVTLRCKIVDQGLLAACKPLYPNPPWQGFEDAAEQLAVNFKLEQDPATRNEKADLSVIVPFDFVNPAGSPRTTSLTNPEWNRVIKPEVATALFPKQALAAGLQTGRAILECVVDQTGALNRCTVASEDPSGLGFGAAALVIARALRMNPWTVDGAPVDGAHIQLPIRLNAPLADAPPGKP